MLADDADAEQFYRDGLARDLSRWPWVRARMELAYGSWLRRHRRVGESRDPLRSSPTTFDLIGAGTWAEQARAELPATGERVQAWGRSAQDSLSPQEMQIARLAAEGVRGDR